MSKVIEKFKVEYEKHLLQIELSHDELFRPTVIDEIEFDEQDLAAYENGDLICYQLSICLDDNCVYIPTLVFEKENPIEQLDILFYESEILEQFFTYFNIEVKHERP